MNKRVKCFIACLMVAVVVDIFFIFIDWDSIGADAIVLIAFIATWLSEGEEI